MNRICWWLVDRASRLLESSERDAVLGDFAESGASGGKALIDLLSLVVRRLVVLRGYGEFCPRLLRSIMGVVIGTGISFCFRDQIYGHLSGALVDAMRAFGHAPRLVYANPIDPFALYIKLSTMCGLFLASPFVVWQLWLLFAPGLYRNLKRFVWAFVTLTSALFFGGGFLAYKLAVPAAARSLVIGIYTSRFPPVVNFNEFWDLTITVVVGAGLVLDLPCLCWLFFLNKKAARLCAAPRNQGSL